MIQHSIPQDITGYKFHLIGSMTLKQFGELAAGSIIAFIVYKSNLIGIVKWPLFIFIIILAIMIAFVPIEERPLDFWIVTFLKNLWKPTKFFWKKTPKVPDFFNYQANQNQNLNVAPEVNYSPARKQRIQEYLKSIPSADEDLDQWDLHYNQRAEELLTNFAQVEIKAENISVQKEIKTSKPHLTTRVRKIKSLEQIQEQQQAQYDQESDLLPTKQETQEKVEIKNTQDSPPLQSINKENHLDKENLPEKESMLANQLFGVVFNQENEPISNALIEVFANNDDQALRISKSNIEGEFSIKTALPNGEYLIKTEARDLNFDPISIRLTGRIVPEIKIIAN